MTAATTSPIDFLERVTDRVSTRGGCGVFGDGASLHLLDHISMAWIVLVTFPLHGIEKDAAALYHFAAYLLSTAPATTTSSPLLESIVANFPARHNHVKDVSISVVSNPAQLFTNRMLSQAQEALIDAVMRFLVFVLTEVAPLLHALLSGNETATAFACKSWIPACAELAVRARKKRNTALCNGMSGILSVFDQRKRGFGDGCSLYAASSSSSNSSSTISYSLSSSTSLSPTQQQQHTGRVLTKSDAMLYDESARMEADPVPNNDTNSVERGLCFWRSIRQAAVSTFDVVRKKSRPPHPTWFSAGASYGYPPFHSVVIPADLHIHGTGARASKIRETVQNTRQVLMECLGISKMGKSTPLPVLVAPTFRLQTMDLLRNAPITPIALNGTQTAWRNNRDFLPRPRNELRDARELQWFPKCIMALFKDVEELRHSARMFLAKFLAYVFQKTPNTDTFDDACETLKQVGYLPSAFDADTMRRDRIGPMRSTYAKYRTRCSETGNVANYTSCANFVWATRAKESPSCPIAREKLDETPLLDIEELTVQSCRQCSSESCLTQSGTSAATRTTVTVSKRTTPESMWTTAHNGGV